MFLLTVLKEKFLTLNIDTGHHQGAALFHQDVISYHLEVVIHHPEVAIPRLDIMIPDNPAQMQGSPVLLTLSIVQVPAVHIEV